MFEGYLIFRSVTGGQRGKAALDRRGLRCALGRSPRQLAPGGCAYALTVRRADLAAAMDILDKERAEPQNVFLRMPDGSYERVSG